MKNVVKDVIVLLYSFSQTLFYTNGKFINLFLMIFLVNSNFA